LAKHTTRRLVLMFLALALAVIAGCAQGANSNSASASNPTPTPTATPVPGSARLTASPASLAFGSLVLNTSTTQTVKITNAGSASITVNGENVTGTGFSTGLTTPITLNAGQSVNASVAFSASSSGSQSGALVLTANGATALTIPLSGTGVTPTAHSVDVSWIASSSSGIQSYNVYRGTTSGGPYSRVSNGLTATATLFTDSTVVSGNQYFYVVTAVNSTGVESVASNEVKAAIPIP
jgi:centrosomal CEP192-like protein